jgi:hypothetical protein
VPLEITLYPINIIRLNTFLGGIPLAKQLRKIMKNLIHSKILFLSALFIFISTFLISSPINSQNSYRELMSYTPTPMPTDALYVNIAQEVGKEGIGGFFVGVGKFCVAQGKEILNMIEDLAVEGSFFSQMHDEKSECFKTMDEAVGDSDNIPEMAAKFYGEFAPKYFVVGPVDGVIDGVSAMANAENSEEFGTALSQTVASGASVYMLGKGGVSLLKGKSAAVLKTSPKILARGQLILDRLTEIGFMDRYSFLQKLKPEEAHLFFKKLDLSDGKFAKTEARFAKAEEYYLASKKGRAVEVHWDNSSVIPHAALKVGKIVVQNSPRKTFTIWNLEQSAARFVQQSKYGVKRYAVNLTDAEIANLTGWIAANTERTFWLGCSETVCKALKEGAGYSLGGYWIERLSSLHPGFLDSMLGAISKHTLKTQGRIEFLQYIGMSKNSCPVFHAYANWLTADYATIGFFLVMAGDEWIVIDDPASTSSNSNSEEMEY